MSRDASALAAGITAAGRIGDRQGVAAVLEKSGPLAADAVTDAVRAAFAETDAAFEAWRQSCAAYRAEAAAALQERTARLVAEVVHVLAQAAGVTRADIERNRNAHRQ